MTKDLQIIHAGNFAIWKECSGKHTSAKIVRAGIVTCVVRLISYNDW